MSQCQLAFALDYPSFAHAKPTLDRIKPHIHFVKLGLELFVQTGPSGVLALTEAGFNVFLDLKLHDIPATVAGAVRSAVALNPSILTVHATGGKDMLRAAVDAASGTQCKVAAVTVLTSINAEDLETMGVRADASEQVLRLANLAWSAGIRAFVCSPQEVGTLRSSLGPEAFLITPGIRLEQGPAHDQKRIASPLQAALDGADLIVVGRPIRDAQSPELVAQQINQQLAAALEPRT